jgi:hypothetical protein
MSRLYLSTTSSTLTNIFAKLQTEAPADLAYELPQRFIDWEG